jgi:2,5-dioxopentanoate dehydrogenase
MSSVNPVFILPGAMRERGEQIAAGLQASVTLGAGQFCTNPGIVFVRDETNAKAFAEKLSALMEASPAFTMLTRGICEAYQKGVLERAYHLQSKIHKEALCATEAGKTQAALFQTDAETFIASRALSDEIFGPTTLLVSHTNRDELLRAAAALEGQLTATVHGTEKDLDEYGDLLALLEAKAGRLLFNGFPTGVEVGHAMVHGGPFPATSDGRSTSVGTRAIFRFTRPVCYQDFPDAALPEELKDRNPLNLQRMVDGKLTKGSIA